MPNFIQSSLGVSVLRMRDFRPSAQSDSATFFGGGGNLRKATAETRAPILTKNTSNDAVPRKEVPFGVAKPQSKVIASIFPKTAILGPISTGIGIFSPENGFNI